MGSLLENIYLYMANSVVMKKVIRIVKRGADDSNIRYWLSLSVQERMAELERMRREVNARFYGTQQGFQRVYRVVKRA